MARAVGSLVGSKDFLMDFFATATLIAAQFVISEGATLTNDGEVKTATTTSTVDLVGTSTDACTFTATPTAEPGRLLAVASGLENIVRIEANPFAIYRLPIWAGATAGTALGVGSGSASANVLIVSTADTSSPYTTVTAAGTTGNVGTIDFSGGLIKGATGANVGQVRKIKTHSASTSNVVGVGFLNPIAVGDRFLRVPFSRQVQTLTLTSDITAANGLLAPTGCTLATLNVIMDEQNYVAFVDVVSRDHQFNPESS